MKRGNAVSRSAPSHFQAQDLLFRGAKSPVFLRHQSLKPLATLPSVFAGTAAQRVAQVTCMYAINKNMTIIGSLPSVLGGQHNLGCSYNATQHEHIASSPEVRHLFRIGFKIRMA